MSPPIGLPMGGVYVVCLDTDITGWENIQWCFADEIDATHVVRVLQARYGEGCAWYTFEPVALSLDEPDVRAYLRDRMRITEARLVRLLLEAAEGP